MKLVSIMGFVYKLSDRNYKQVLQNIADGKLDDNSDLLGVSLGYVKNITDMGQDEAQDELDHMKRRAKKS